MAPTLHPARPLLNTLQKSQLLPAKQTTKWTLQAALAKQAMLEKLAMQAAQAPQASVPRQEGPAR